MTILQTLTTTLVPTILIEYGVLVFLRERRRKVLWASVVVNILTNIPLNLYFISHPGGLTAVCIAETLVVLIEALWYYWFVRHLSQAFVYSFLCNAISFLTGLSAQLLFHILFTNNITTL